MNKIIVDINVGNLTIRAIRVLEITNNYFHSKIRHFLLKYNFLDHDFYILTSQSFTIFINRSRENRHVQSGRRKNRMAKLVLKLSLLSLILMALVLTSYTTANASHRHEKHPCTQLWVYTLPVQKGRALFSSIPAVMSWKKPTELTSNLTKVSRLDI
jgi:hypothetical protein